MKSFTKEEILNLLENPTSLKNAIIESKGFVLYQSAFYKIDIPKKLLIDTINQYSIRFMVQNFKDTDYSKKEIELIASFIKEDAVEKEVVKVIDYILDNQLFKRQVVNLASPQSSCIYDIVAVLESLTQKRAVYTVADKGAFYHIDLSQVQPIYHQLGIEFDADYVSRTISKYYANV